MSWMEYRKTAWPPILNSLFSFWEEMPPLFAERLYTDSRFSSTEEQSKVIKGVRHSSRH